MKNTSVKAKALPQRLKLNKSLLVLMIVVIAALYIYPKPMRSHVDDDYLGYRVCAGFVTKNGDSSLPPLFNNYIDCYGVPILPACVIEYPPKEGTFMPYSYGEISVFSCKSTILDTWLAYPRELMNQR